MPVIEIYRARIDPANVERLLAIRDAAVAEFQREIPELVQAELVRLDGDVWLDVLTWSEAVDEERIAQASQRTPAAAEMHGLMTEMLGHDRGEVVRSSAGARAGVR